jgi:acyl-ACP thioesterase
MIDCNDHVHNTAYMDLFAEALPEDEDMDRFSDLTLVYRREIRPGQRIKAVYGRTGEEHVVALRAEDTDQVHAFLLLR